ncbi:MAG: diphosphomevalonate decarboxylase [Myxococcales bacterium FL481]|nr:MAG: diphosphomevalonate decarboxylase [Myxococcales bacterium FL481]
MLTATARAHTNIALVKYWGKRDGLPDQNLPDVGSLSLTLAELFTETKVEPAAADALELDGAPAQASVAQRAFRHLDRVWSQSPQRDRSRPGCRVVSSNHVPTAAGLASSASGFAALTLAAATSFGLDPDRAALSALARRGSGSAARSMWGGFVRLDRGVLPDGSDCRARPLHTADHWDVRLVVARATARAKTVGSTEGMTRSRETSAYYPAWVDTSAADLDAAEQALAARDLTALGRVVERSCFKMHACMLASEPPLIYWNATSLNLVQAVFEARQMGLEGYLTSDAGPHIKVLCRREDAAAWADRLRHVERVVDVAVLRPGPDATVTFETAAR